MTRGLNGAAQRFVGRAHPLRQVATACEVLDRGRGCVVVVSGEAGVGKTWFCDEVAEEAAACGIRVVTARCWLDGGAPPLWPWQSILAQLGGERSGDLLASDAAVSEVGPDRFARFVAVTDRLAEACAQGPMCLVIDDIHGADAGTLLLTRFVARSLSRLPLALVLSRRGTTPAGDGPEAQLLREIEGEATSVVLRGFDLAETTAFLAEHGLGSLDPDVVATVFRVTGGHPLFLRRIVETIGRPGAEPPVPGGLPGGLEVAIRQALDRLTPNARRILSTAAVLGLAPSVNEAAEVAGCDTVAVLEAVAEGAAAGLVAGPGDVRFDFVHDLVRSAIEASLGAADRLDAHARAATVVTADGGTAPTADRLARAAHHARRAAARSPRDARRAISICQTAAEAMVHAFAYEQADELLTAAVELHPAAGLGPPETCLALAWAEAASLRGHMDVARSRYRTAVARAEADGEPALLAEAALGLGGMWLDEHYTPVERARVLGLYQSALDELPADDPDHEPLRCRLVTRLAAEAAFGGGPTQPVYDAIDAARRCSDPHALAEALSLAHHALFTPEHTRSRLGLADELVRLTSETDQGVLSLMGLLWRTIDLMHLGDSRARRALEVLRRRATALGNQHILYNVGVIDVLYAINRGSLAEAESEAERCFQLGEQVGKVDSLAYFAAQLAIIRWLQGRDAELLHHVEEVTTSPTLSDTEFSLRATAACLAARSGEHARARAILDRHLPGKLDDLVLSGTWMAGLVALVEAAAVLEDRELAGQAYELLEPYADLPVVVGLGIACLGSTERTLGVAAATVGHHEVAIRHLERAMVANERIPNRPMLAMARADLARVLGRLSDPATRDEDRAADLLGQAIAEANAMGLTGRVAEWEDELQALRTGPTGAAGAAGRAGTSTSGGPTGHRPGAPASGPAAVAAVGDSPAVTGGGDGSDGGERSDGGRAVTRGVIRQEGRRWTIAVGEHQARVGNLVGMAYLAELLTHPRQHIPASALAGSGNGPAGASPQALVDDQARRAYVVRARELSEDLREAEAAHDLHRAERLRAELDTLVDHIEAATGFQQHPRRFVDDNERARTAVRKAIKRAIDAVADADATLAEMLRETVSTGSTCTYTPDHRHPVTWSAS